MDYRILGPLEVIDAGEPIDVGSRQQRGLLALLLLNANRVVPTERILDELWHDDANGKERTLWVYISRLRSILEPGRQAHDRNTVLVTRDHGYSLLIDDGHVDAHRFEDLAAEGNRLLDDDPDEAARVLNRGLDLWRGTALEDFRYDDFAQADAARLEELRLVAIEDRIDADIRAMRHRNVVGELEQLSVDHPHRERLVRLRMIALYRSGRQADALRAFEHYRRTVGDELGIVPSPELRHVQEQVLLHDDQLAPTESPITLEPTTLANPFKGLHAFTEADGPTFYGRDRLIAEVVERIESGPPLVALVGASGSGKSSVLRAGLVPQLRSGDVNGCDRWLVAQMVPGSRPFRELEAALFRAAPDAPEHLGRLLDEPEDGLLRACLRLLPDDETRLALVIDQFEELFTLGAPSAEQHRFVRNLEVVVDDGRGRVVIAIGLRADFYGRPLAYPRFAQLLGQGIVNVVPLTLDELEAAAQRPAAVAGVDLEPALLVQLLADVAGQVGGLPLFQYALTELFERRRGSTLTLAAYVEMSGVNGALAQRAEELFQGFTDDEQSATKQLFLRLVTVVEQGAWGRRRVPASEIVSIAADVLVLQAILERFGDRRLLTFDRDPVTESPTVEVAHEALLNEWPRLRRWIDDGQKDVQRRARLATALDEWAASGENDDYLLSGERLADYERWAAVSTLRLSRDEERFLDASILRRERARLAEEERQAREVQLDRTARRRLWVLAVGALLVVAAVAGGVLLARDESPPAIALVRGVGGDLGINDLMIEGAVAAGREHELEVDQFEALVDPEGRLRHLAETGTDLVIVSSQFDLALDAVAEDYPDVQWVAIDPDAVHIEAPNLTEMHFAVERSAFLAGTAAARMSQSGRVGFVGGFQSFRTEKSRNGFEQGAAWAEDGIDVVSTYLGPVVNAQVDVETEHERAHELATDLYAAGVDVIFHDAGAAGAGVIRAAREWAAAHDHVWTIGSDVDEYLTASAADQAFILTSTIKRFDAAVELAISEFLDGELAAGDTDLGLAQDGIALSRSGDHLASIDGPLKNLEGELLLGHLRVSPYADRAPQWQLTHDVTIELAIDGGTCGVVSIDGATLDGGRVSVPRGSNVLFELTNSTADLGGIALRSVPVGLSTDELLAEAELGIPTSFGAIHAMSAVEPGGRTSSAAIVERTPVAPNCKIGDFDDAAATDYVPLIVSPT